MMPSPQAWQRASPERAAVEKHMCNISCIDFAGKVLKDADISGKDVLEVGSFNVNGSVRDLIRSRAPASYTGVDIAEGPGVDMICRAEDLIPVFKKDSFGLVISTEAIEHIRDWRKVVSNMKNLLCRGGVLLITTRSKGFGYHGYPNDFWRFELTDIREVFSDMTITDLEADPSSPGILMKAVKGPAFVEKDLSGYELFSMVTGTRCVEINGSDYILFRVKHRISMMRNAVSARIPVPIKSILKGFLRMITARSGT